MKKLSIGACITIIAIVLAAIGFFVYSSNVGGEGYYKDAVVSNFALLVWGAIACLCMSVILSILKGGKVIEVITGILRIGAPALLAWALMNLVAGRVDGLGYIYFSNADVAKEVQTAANMASAQSAIWSMILVGAAMLFAVIAAFFSLRKKNQ